MEILNEILKPRRNFGKGVRKPPKRYDGTGPSGYTSPETPANPNGRTCVLLPIKDVPEALLRPTGGKKSRRPRTRQWVVLEDLRKYA
jgi:hypothetical protein